MYCLYIFQHYATKTKVFYKTLLHSVFIYTEMKTMQLKREIMENVWCHNPKTNFTLVSFRSCPVKSAMIRSRVPFFSTLNVLALFDLKHFFFENLLKNAMNCSPRTAVSLRVGHNVPSSSWENQFSLVTKYTSLFSRRFLCHSYHGELIL